MAPDSPNSADNWRPTASLATLRLRAQLLARIRGFFAQRGVLEVETPLLSHAATTDPNLHSFLAQSLAPGDAPAAFYLQTSPEFAMKRLLAAGSAAIYQVAKVFRADEIGRLHNPEFTMIEWYRTDFDYHRLMTEVGELVAESIAGLRRLQPAEKLSYATAFLRHAGVDPHTASSRQFADAARSHGIAVAGLAEDDCDAWRDLLLTHVVEPQLGRERLTFLYDYPASAAALARVRPDDPPVAERFELYLDGIELANGFQELTDVDEQHRRFERDKRRRVEQGLAAIPSDQQLLAALAHGLPHCSGVALGLDRLLMCASGARSITDVLAFPFDRA
jgi:lysyl-tRNA synthetase class 2